MDSSSVNPVDPTSNQEPPRLFSNSYVSQVTSRIFLGNKTAAQDMQLLQEHNIKYIVNAAGGGIPNYFPEEFVYLNVILEDDVEEDLLSHLDKPLSFMQQVENEPTSNVLVHCRAGVSRSASIVIAYLMIHKKFTLAQAFLLVKERRPAIQPNEGYLKQLADLESRLFGKQTFSVKDYYVNTLVTMGFQREYVETALTRTNYDFEMAVQLLVYRKL